MCRSWRGTGREAASGVEEGTRDAAHRVRKHIRLVRLREVGRWRGEAPVWSSRVHVSLKRLASSAAHGASEDEGEGGGAGARASRVGEVVRVRATGRAGGLPTRGKKNIGEERRGG
jgi:hypothetical protein